MIAARSWFLVGRYRGAGRARLFRDEVVSTVLRLNGEDADHADEVADAVLPDVLTLDMRSFAGFPNGRRPESDWVDVLLALLTNGALTTDGLPGNDVVFLNLFPFFAPPVNNNDIK